MQFSSIIMPISAMKNAGMQPASGPRVGVSVRQQRVDRAEVGFLQRAGGGVSRQGMLRSGKRFWVEYSNFCAFNTSMLMRTPTW